MEKEFVPYELALRLKALGFDEPCFGYYIELVKPIEGILTIEQCDKNVDGCCIAPTFSQCFRWFREKYYLDSWVYCSDESKGYFAIIVSCKRLVFYNENKETYEEAELACLDKLIEIVEQKEK